MDHDDRNVPLNILPAWIIIFLIVCCADTKNTVAFGTDLKCAVAHKKLKKQKYINNVPRSTVINSHGAASDV